MCVAIFAFFWAPQPQAKEIDSCETVGAEGWALYRARDLPHDHVGDLRASVPKQSGVLQDTEKLRRPRHDRGGCWGGDHNNEANGAD